MTLPFMGVMGIVDSYGGCLWIGMDTMVYTVVYITHVHYSIH
jgi:hypothetical protein